MRPVFTDLFERWTAGERSFGLYLYAFVALPLSWLYRLGLAFSPPGRKRHSALTNTKLLVVSSPMVGGVGKTPMSIVLIDQFKKRGESVAAVTMGYGLPERRRASYLPKNRPDVEDVGDEGLEIGIFTSVEVHTGPEPADVIDELDDRGEVDWIVFDDGVSRSWAGETRIALLSSVDLEQPVRYLPYGRWRTTPRALSLASYVAITLEPNPLSPEKHLRQLATWGYRGPVGWFQHRPVGFVRWSQAEIVELKTLPDGPALVFCGIARPHRFRDRIVEAAIPIADFVTFPDHHGYSPTDCEFLRQRLRQSGATWFLTTFKDLARTPPDWTALTPLVYWRICLHQVAGDDLLATVTKET